MGALGLNFPGSVLAMGFDLGTCALKRAQKLLSIGWRIRMFDDSVDSEKQVWAWSLRSTFL